MSNPPETKRPAPLDQITAEAILAGLKKEGIQTLDEFAHRYAEAVRSSMHANPQLQASFGPSFASPPKLKQKQLKHRVPSHPLTVDGVSIEPHSISKYDGKPLHFFASAESHAKNQLTAYTSEEQLQHEIKAHSAVTTSVLRGSSVWNETGYCYENIDLSGQVLRIPRMNDFWNFNMPDLNYVYRNCFLWWCWNPWNDIISSISTEDHVVRFWENPNSQGSSITFGVWTKVQSLVPYGWNDRISSLALLGV